MKINVNSEKEQIDLFLKTNEGNELLTNDERTN